MKKKFKIITITIFYTIFGLYNIGCNETKKTDLTNKSPKELNIIAYYKQSQGLYKQSIEAHSKIMEFKSINPIKKQWAYYNIGYNYYLLYDYKKAIKIFEKLETDKKTHSSIKALCTKMLKKLKENRGYQSMSY